MKQTREITERCAVYGAELLPIGSGGAEELCMSIERELAELPGPGYTVEVRIIRRDILSATVVTGDGVRLPELNTSVSNSTFTRQIFDRFAKSLAKHVATYSRRS